MFRVCNVKAERIAYSVTCMH